jgi:sugar lactone lactonase YvrE
MNIRRIIVGVFAVCAALWAIAGTARGQMFVSVNSNPFTNGGSRVYQYDPTGSTGSPVMPYFLDNLDHPREVAFDSAGNLYVATFTWLLDSAGEIVDFDHAAVLKVSGGVASSFATFYGGSAHGLAFDSGGNLFVSSAKFDGTASTIYKITPDGVVSTFGFDETIQGSVPGQCFDLKVDSAGNLFAAGADSTLTYGTIYEFPTEGPLAGVRSIFVDSGAFSSGGPIGLAFDNSVPQNLFVSTNNENDSPGGKIRSFDSNGMEILPQLATGLTKFARGLAFDSAGNLFCAEIGNGALVGDILKFTPEGTGTIPGITTAPGFGVNYFAEGTTSDFGFRGNRGPEYVAFAPPAGPPTPPSTSVVLTFPSTTEPLTTTVVASLDQNSVPLPSPNFELTGSNLAFDISTPSGEPTSPIIVALTVPSSVWGLDGSGLKVMHYENGSWVDRTIDKTNPNYPLNPASNTIYGSVDSLSPFLVTQFKYAAQIQQPINSNGTSVFNAKRGVIPVAFKLTSDGVATCQLPPATISVFRTSGGVVGSVDESVYLLKSDSGSNFRIDSTKCQYTYNLGASSLGAGTYQVNISIDGSVAGSATFALK